MSEQGRWTRAGGEHGVDPRDADAEHEDPEQARIRAEQRPVVNDEEPSGEQGISSDRPGVDPSGYPGPRQIVDDGTEAEAGSD